MATGDILSAVVRADGWSMDVTIEGFAVGVTYDFGSLDDTPATVTAPMFSVAVVSEGYNAAGVLGTIARTVYGTHVVRKAYPNQASKDEVVSGSDIVVRVALSESIYNDDKNGGAGTSGTNPAVTISAAWATNTGGGAQTSAAATALACTNNSTLDYPAVIAQWAWGHTPAFRRVAAAFDIGCIAYHGHGIACVDLSATEGVNVVSGIATAPAAHQMSASQLYYESYDLNVPLTSMTQGNDITLRFIAYPRVGDADSIIDTENLTALLDVPNGKARITCTCDKTGALTFYAVVSSAGVDATGAKSAVLATAEASPYLTIGKALESGASVVYVKAGAVFDILGSTTTVAAKNYYIDVSPYPGDAVTLNRGGTYRYPGASKLRYSGFTITCNSANGYLNSSACKFRQFDSCTFTISVVPSAGLSYAGYGVWFNNCTLAGDEYYLRTNGGSLYNYTGNVFVGKINSSNSWRTCVANAYVGNNTAGMYWGVDTATGTPTIDNFIMANNKFVGCYQATSGQLEFGWANVPLAFIGNLFEISNVTSGGKNFKIYADGSVDPANNIIVAHNTMVGFRIGIAYNDAGATAYARTNVFVRNNAFSNYNIKSDVTGTPNAARIGGWACLNGVNYSDNVYEMTSALNFVNDYEGINCKYWVSKATEGPSSDLGFTNDACAYGSAAGNGNYMPTDVSVLYDHDLVMVYQSFDLYGTAL